MKLEIKSNCYDVIGCCEISNYPTFINIVRALSMGYQIICKSNFLIKDSNEYYAFIIYDKNDISGCNYSFIGKAKFLGPHPDYDYPLAYRFFPSNLVEAQDFSVYDLTGEPFELFIKSKKL